MTFGSFSLREREKLTRRRSAPTWRRPSALAQEFAEHPRGWLVLSGTYGCGKTHLAAAIGNYQASQGQPPMFVVVPDLLDHLRSTFSPNSSDLVRRDLRGGAHGPPADPGRPGHAERHALGAREALPDLQPPLHGRAAHGDHHRQPLDEIDPRIRSRMLDTRLCTFFGILAPAFAPRRTERKQSGGEK